MVHACQSTTTTTSTSSSAASASAGIRGTASSSSARGRASRTFAQPACAAHGRRFDDVNGKSHQRLMGGSLAACRITRDPVGGGRGGVGLIFRRDCGFAKGFPPHYNAGDRGEPYRPLGRLGVPIPRRRRAADSTTGLGDSVARKIRENSSKLRASPGSGVLRHIKSLGGYVCGGPG
jgi:hypothetical protein